MKKLIAIGIAVLLVLGVSALSYADTIQTQKDITVTMDVTSVFGMEIWDTEYIQDPISVPTLANITPGGAGMGDIHIFASANHEAVWYVNAQSSGLTGATHGDTLAVQISTFDGGAGPVGTFVTDQVLSGVAVPIYTAAASEYSIAGLEIAGVYAIPTTATTKEDTYSGTLVLTMTE